MVVFRGVTLSSIASQICCRFAELWDFGSLLPVCQPNRTWDHPNDRWKGIHKKNIFFLGYECYLRFINLSMGRLNHYWKGFWCIIMNKQMQVERWKSDRTSHLPTFDRSMINLSIITFHVQNHLELVKRGFPEFFLDDPNTKKRPSLKLTASLPLKMDGWNTNFRLGMACFQQGSDSFREDFHH